MKDNKDLKEVNTTINNNLANSQNIKLAKSLNFTSKINSQMFPTSKVKKDQLEKYNNTNKTSYNNVKSIGNNNTKKNNNNTNFNNFGLENFENKNQNNFVKKEVCRIFNSDDFYERNRTKKLLFQETANNLNNLKLNSFYSKDVSQKVNKSKNIQINLYNNPLIILMMRNFTI